MAEAIAGLDYPIVGSNLMFEQTTATVALFNRIKRLRPDVTLIVGGALCEGPMAEGIATLTDAIDAIFSGESEETFIRFLESHRQLGKAVDRIVRGKPCFDLDALPLADYGDYFHQLETFYPASEILGEKTDLAPLRRQPRLPAG